MVSISRLAISRKLKHGFAILQSRVKVFAVAYTPVRLNQSIASPLAIFSNKDGFLLSSLFSHRCNERISNHLLVITFDCVPTNNDIQHGFE